MMTNFIPVPVKEEATPRYVSSADATHFEHKRDRHKQEAVPRPRQSQPVARRRAS
jgi:hypothetical protein